MLEAMLVYGLVLSITSLTRRSRSTGKTVRLIATMLAGESRVLDRGTLRKRNEALRELLGQSGDRVDADTIRRIVREELRKTR